MHGLAHKIESELLRGDWSEEERRIADQTLAKLPSRLTVDNPNLKSVDRQKALKPKPQGAPGDSEFTPDGRVVVFDKGVYNQQHKVDPDNLKRSVLHELAHSVDDEVPKVFNEWKALSGWTLKGTTWSYGPSATFVDDYAKTSPFEDWADTFSEYFIHPEIVSKRYPQKFRFIQRFLGAVTRGEIKLKKKERA